MNPIPHSDLSSRRVTAEVLVFVLVLCFATRLEAQVPTAILRVGDPAPSVGPNAVVSSISNTAVNGVFGFAVTVRTDDGVTVRSHIWGAQNGGTAGMLWTNQVVGALDQAALEDFFGIDDSGSLGYSAVCNELTSGAIDLDTMWVGASVQAVEGQPNPALPGTVWRFLSRPGITRSGTPYWIAGINDQASGAVIGSGLFLAGVPLLKTGDVIVGLPGPLDTSAVEVNYRFSAHAKHWITPVDVVTGSALDDGHLLVDGAPIVSGSGTIAENQVIASGVGGVPGERWDNFDFVGISESGEFFLTGDTDAAFPIDEFIARNGTIIYREGDLVDGMVLSGAIEAAAMNERGDIAYVWDVEGVTGDVEAVFLNARCLLKEGDAIDFDGDGLLDPSAVVADFTGVSSLSVGEDKTIYVTADIDVLGTPSPADDIEVVLAIHDPCGSVRRYGVGCAGTGGVSPDLGILGCVEPGGTVTVAIEGGVGGGPAVVLFGATRGDALLSPSKPDCLLWIGDLQPVAIVLPLGGAPGAPGAGSVFAATVIPSNIPVVRFTMCAIVYDPQNPFSGAVTNGLEVEIGF